MSNVGRLLTLVVRVEDEDDAKEVWEAHKNQTFLSGLKVKGIADGNLIEELRLREEYTEYVEEFSEGPSGPMNFEDWKEENV